MSDSRPFLNVYFVWHPGAQARYHNLADKLFVLLDRDPEASGTRGIGIPTYFRSVPEDSKSTLPVPIDLAGAVRTIAFVFVEEHMLVDRDTWGLFVADLYSEAKSSDSSHAVFLIGFRTNSPRLHQSLNETNFIRLWTNPEMTWEEELVGQIAHEICRHLENRRIVSPSGHDLGPAPMKLFISHTKQGEISLPLAEALKRYVESTRAKTFFDAVDIVPGYSAWDQIRGHIEQGTLVAIRTDSYSSRPWCRREVLEAKRLKRPMVVVEALTKSDVRSLPYIGNVPCVRFDAGQVNFSDYAALRPILKRVVDFALSETLRFVYAEGYLKHLQASGIICSDATLLARPPEESDFKEIMNTLRERETNVQTAGVQGSNRPHKIIYPDPPLGPEELDALQREGVEFATPTSVDWAKFTGRVVVGLSISDSEDLARLGLSKAHLKLASQDFALHCLTRGATIAYGGDLRQDGFTQSLFDLVRVQREIRGAHLQEVWNFQAWPLYLTHKIDEKWEADHLDVAKVERIPPPSDLLASGIVEETEPVSPSSPRTRYIWARCLTKMREKMNEVIDARVLIGGQLKGYKGKYPGLVEEAFLAIRAAKPVFLLGGFGGVTKAIIDAIRGKKPDSLTLQYQCGDKDYERMIEFYKTQNRDQNLSLEPIDYERVVREFNAVGIKGLNNGLTDEENNILFRTQNREQAVVLVLRGLSRFRKA